MGEYISRAAYLSFAIAVALAAGLQFWPDTTQQALGNQPRTHGIASDGLITHIVETEGRPTRAIIIDPRLQVMGVYDISRDSGEIELKSVRKLTADLQMLEFNNAGVSVEDIQKALERQQ
ncbi:MAG: hypothetical protein GXP26_16890 [Planctomycetes bacterium]|nr:hypothetical protein [Planctomycetota bacterium]